MTTVYAVLEWEGDHTSNIVGILTDLDRADLLAEQGPKGSPRTVEPYELDEIEEWAR